MAAWSSSLSGLPISFPGSSPVPAISSSSLSPSSSIVLGASGASKGLSDIGIGVDSKGFCGDAEDVFGFGVLNVSGAVMAVGFENSNQHYLCNCMKRRVIWNFVPALFSEKAGYEASISSFPCNCVD